MKISITAILVIHACCLLHAEDVFDPQRLPPPVSDEDTQPKIITNFTCFSSGTLTGEALDSRVESIVLAISAFHAEEKRVPKGIPDLSAFCKKRGFDLHDLVRLSPVELVEGTFKYSAEYASGTLHLTHLSGRYFTSAMLQPFDKNNPILQPDNKQNKAEMATPRKPSD